MDTWTTTEIVPGLAGEASLDVTDSDTAIAMGSGDVAVLATPRVVALCEEATCAALNGHLPGGTTSVGSRVEIDHRAPTAPGDTVVARAEVETVQGRTIVFTVSARDSGGLVASGRITRSLVRREAFLSKLH